MPETYSLRKTFGETLIRIGLKHRNFVVIDCDPTNSLFTANFAKQFPNRHFNLNFQERTAINMAIGFAARTKTAIICAQAQRLIYKAYEQIRNEILIPNLNIKLIASGCGLSNAEEGPLDHCIEDLNLLLPYKNIKIFNPADHLQTKLICENLLLDYSPTYLRLPRDQFTQIFDPQINFSYDKFNIIKSGFDATIITSGPILIEVLKAINNLEKKGTTFTIINLPTLNFNYPNELLAEITKTKYLITIEEHSIIGGLGDRIIQLLNSQPSPIPIKTTKIGISKPTHSAPRSQLLKLTKLDAKSLYNQIRDFLFKQ